MDIDDSIAPLLAKMEAALHTVQSELLPRLDALDEDTVVSNYSLDEQARLFLSAAFTLSFSLYALDKISNKQHAVSAAKRSGGGGASSASASANFTVATGGSAVDEQLILKIERITDYIKKLREIAALEKAKAREQAMALGTATSTTAGADGSRAPSATATADSTKAVATVAAGSGGAGGQGKRKRARTETSPCSASSSAAPVASDASSSSAAVQHSAAKEEDDMGDSAMFSVVSRVPGETGTLVSRLMRHVE